MLSPRQTLPRPRAATNIVNPFLTLPTARVGEVARFVSTDKIAGRLGEFPELTRAVREGDLEKVSTLCAQLFILNSVPSVQPDIRFHDVAL